ncbi:hypothetical protein RUM43_012077 [Polyplax serrata]|uniref:DEP domain-containing protein n=1 Tax=Polyplax serrata TaxID=468196 RepID=A0AAN8P2Z4_POLSC
MNGSEHSGSYFDKEINLDNLYSALIECFSVILCGYAAGKLHLISPRETRGLDVFVRAFSLPSIIFLSLAQLDLSTVNWKFLGSILVSKTIVFCGVIIVTLFLSRPVHLGRTGLYAVFCTQSNDFAIGYPILNALYGTEHPYYPSYVYLLAPISLAVLNPIACILLEIGKIQDREVARIDGEQHKEVIDGVDGPQRPKVSESRTKSKYDSLQSSDIAPKNNPYEGKSRVQFCGRVFLNIATNPIMVMTLMGMLGSLFYHYIKFVGVVLNAFAKVFSTMALFVLGLRMVGTANNLKGNALVAPGILIITKLLVFPLITREVVSLLHTGTNATETLNLSTFGFMYGTFPSAPMVFVLATQYEVEVDAIASSLVICTFLSAPLMYISAKMVFMDFIPSSDYYRKLETFTFNLGIFGIPLGIWLLVLFLVNKAFSKVPHRVTGFLIISQILLCIGAALHPLRNLCKPWSAYVQFFIFAFGLYSSRLWAGFLAATLAVLQSRSLCFVIKLVPGFIALAWGIPAILVVAECFVSVPNYEFESLVNPDFNHKMFQSVVTLLLLSVSFVGTSVCLILQQRYQKRFAKYMVLVHEVNSKDLQDVRETNIAENSERCNEACTGLTDIEEIVSETKPNICSGDCKDEGLCSSEFSCTEVEREMCEQRIKQYKNQVINEEMDEDHQDRQILKHVVLLLLLVTSMFVNLMLSIWTLVVEDAVSGLYVELLFLNITLNIGQIFITFPVFGFDSRILISNLTNRWRRFCYGAECIVLTPPEDLGFETTHVCQQFIAHHLHDCEGEIAKNKRLRLRMYRDCFQGKTLVSWLQAQRLAKDETEAIQYACHLLEGRVLRHIENRHHFENSNLLYTFKQY